MMQDNQACAARQSLASVSAENHKIAQEVADTLDRCVNAINGPTPTSGEKMPGPSEGLIGQQLAVGALLRRCVNMAQRLAGDFVQETGLRR